MSGKLTRLLVKDFFGIYSIDWIFNKDVTVLVGKNGVGKSTLLNLIYCALQPEELMNKSNSFPFNVISSIELFFDDKSSIKVSHQELTQEDLEKLTYIFNDEKFQDRLFKSISKKISQENISKGLDLKEFNEKLKLFFEHSNLNKQLSHIESKKLSVEFNESDPKKIEENYKVEFISTLFMNANSVNEVKWSNGRIANILDIEIKHEILNLLSLKDNRSNIDKFLNVMNSFLKDTEKEIIQDGSNFKFRPFNKNDLLDIKQLSSGERQLFYICIKTINLLSEKNKQPILLMDEPEISLHPAWQDKLLEKIIEINPKMQIILVTHSPAIIMNGWRNKYIDIKDILNKG